MVRPKRVCTAARRSSESSFHKRHSRVSGCCSIGDELHALRKQCQAVDGAGARATQYHVVELSFRQGAGHCGEQRGFR
jgi:hypothetical protein